MDRHADTRTSTSRRVTGEVVAEVYGMTLDTLYRLVRTGRVPAYKVGRHYRFDLDAVEEALRYRPADEDVG